MMIGIPGTKPNDQNPQRHVTREPACNTRGPLAPAFFLGTSHTAQGRGAGCEHDPTPESLQNLRLAYHDYIPVNRSTSASLRLSLRTWHSFISTSSTT
eukprot:3678992-Rhodomonas_salina.3